MPYELAPIWLPLVFALGLGARLVGLPPLVGFLIAGFALNALGFEASDQLDQLADLGVTLLLFTIGLKLRVQSLLSPEIWAGTTLQMGITLVFFASAFVGLAATGLSAFAGVGLTQALLIGFALSFSSTVFAVKVLDDRGEVDSRHGRTAIGMLIMQDVIAVVFLALSTGKLPSPWAIALVGLLLLRPVLYAILDRAGHGDLLILLGFLLAIGLGWSCFETLGVKGDLGALIIGMLLAPHPKAKELASTLLGFKDLLLVGFFLSIGLKGLPDLQGLWIALGLALLVPVKVLIYFLLLSRFRLRARTSVLVSLALANYSEFGLIVGSIAVVSGWLGAEWLVVIAIALSISLIAAAPLNTAAHRVYDRVSERARRFESAVCLPEDEPIDVGDAEVIVFGMGRVGASAYDVMRERYGEVVLGIDADADVIAHQAEQGRRALQGDAADADFWARVLGESGDAGPKVRTVLLALPEHRANRYAAEQIRRQDAHVHVASIARYDEEIEELQALGVRTPCNLYSEAGLGFAESICHEIDAEAA